MAFSGKSQKKTSGLFRIARQSVRATVVIPSPILPGAKNPVRVNGLATTTNLAEVKKNRRLTSSK